MAEIIDGFPTVGAQGPWKYPWDDWLDGRVWQLTEGVDYKNKHTLRTSALSAAANRGKKARVSYRGSTIILQAYVATEGVPDPGTGRRHRVVKESNEFTRRGLPVESQGTDRE